MTQITGSLHNANHMPPLELPLKKDAAESSAYNDYDYFSYTVGGESGTTKQSIFETRKTILSLAKNGTCSFSTDETYHLTQSAIGTSATTIQHNEFFSTNKLMPTCSVIAVSGSTISLLVNGAASRRISFVHVVKKLSASATDLPL